MTPLEFTLWMGGATDLVGDSPPSPEQWARIREKLTDTLVPIAATKLLDTADELSKKEFDKKERFSILELIRKDRLLMDQRIQEATLRAYSGSNFRQAIMATGNTSSDGR